MRSVYDRSIGSAAVEPAAVELGAAEEGFGAAGVVRWCGWERRRALLSSLILHTLINSSKLSGREIW